MPTLFSYSSSSTSTGFDYLSSGTIAVAQSLQAPVVPVDNRGQEYADGYMVPKTFNIYAGGWKSNSLFTPAIWSATTGINAWLGDGKILPAATSYSQVNLQSFNIDFDAAPTALKSGTNYYFGGRCDGQTGTGISLRTLSAGGKYYYWDNAYSFSNDIFTEEITRSSKTLYMWIDYGYVSSAPRNLMATGLRGNYVYLKWDAPLDDGGFNVEKYYIYYKKSTDSSWTLHYEEPSDTYLELNLDAESPVAGDSYDFKVSAYNAASAVVPYGKSNPIGESAFSNTDVAILEGQGPKVFTSDLTWVPSDMFVYSSGSWTPASINVYDGTTWKEV